MDGPSGRLLSAGDHAAIGETVGVDSPDDLNWPSPGELAAGRLLYEPDAAVVRAHLVGPLARNMSWPPSIH